MEYLGWVKNDSLHGRRTILTYPKQKRRYVGEMSDGYRNGFGLDMKGEDRAAGLWVKDKREGNFVVSFLDSSRPEND